MLLGHAIDKYKANDHVEYQLIQNDLVGMGPTRAFSFSIHKYCDGEYQRKRIISGVKNREAAMMIWEDVKAGKQKG